MTNIQDLQSKIGYRFKDENLLLTALTHQSLANENGSTSYERLEFLGDAVIELIVSDFIYSNFDYDAGLSTRLRASLVSTENLSKIALNLELHTLVLKSKSLQGLSKKNSADLVESLTGAIYKDGGFKVAHDFVKKFVIVDKKSVENFVASCVDFKTKLQELLQGENRPFEYRILSSSGLDHDKVFEVGLLVDGQLVSRAQGKSIRIAEESCAEEFFKLL